MFRFILFLCMSYSNLCNVNLYFILFFHSVCYSVPCIQSERVFHYGSGSLSNLPKVEFCSRRRSKVGPHSSLTKSCNVVFSWKCCHFSRFWCLFLFFSDCEVFQKNHAAPFSKVLTFYRKEAFSLEAYYNCPKELPYPDPTIGEVWTFEEDSISILLSIGSRIVIISVLLPNPGQGKKGCWGDMKYKMNMSLLRH